MKPAPARSVIRCLLLLALAGAWSCTPARTLTPTAADRALVDDVAAARIALEESRTAVRIGSGDPVASRVERLVHLGLLVDADSLLASAPGPRTVDLALAEATLRLAQYRIGDAAVLVDGVRAADPDNRPALRTVLRIAELSGDWQEVRVVAEALLRRGARDAAGSAAAAALGREALRAGDVEVALEWAARARAAREPVVDGWLLEAAARAWSGDLEGEVIALRGALLADPFASEARYRYGMVAWRQGGAAGAAAAGEQWWLALQADPLHLPTHQLLASVCGLRVPTPAWVARPHAAVAPPEIGGGAEGHPLRLPAASSAVAQPAADEAIRRGAVWYRLGAENPAAFDSALIEFRSAVAISPGEPRAHRGITAVLDHRLGRAYQGADSVAALAREWPLPNGQPLAEVIPRLAEPQLEPAARLLSWRLGGLGGYLPLLARLGARVHVAELDEPLIPVESGPALAAPTPLGHCGWAEAPVRLTAASVNDLRADAPDAHQVIHQLVHLLHDGVLTGEQRRRLRAHYRAAVAQGRRLTDRAADDEVEYLAAGVAAYQNAIVSSALADPRLTRSSLLRYDSDLYLFIEELVTGGAAAAAGDTRFLRSNLAELYTQLARAARQGGAAGRGGVEQAGILLDSALVFDGSYRPALLEFAHVEAARGRPDRAEEWLRVAEGLGADDPATLATRAALLGTTPSGALGGYEARVALLNQAIALEGDPVLRAGYRVRLRDLHRAAGRLPEAIGGVVEALENESAETPRDRSLRSDAEAEMMEMWLTAGHGPESARYFAERVDADPLDPLSRARYVDALLMSGDTATALDVLDEGLRLHSLAGPSPPALDLRGAELTLAAGEPRAAVSHVEPLLEGDEHLPATEGLRLVRLLIAAGESSEAQRQLTRVPEPTGDAERAAVLLTRGRIMEWRGDEREAERYYREAVALDPYDVTVREALYDFLQSRGRSAEAAQVSAAAPALQIRPGPIPEQ